MDLFPQIIKDTPQWALCGFTGNGASPKQPYVWNNDTGKPEALRKDGNKYGSPNLHLLMDFETARSCQQYYNKLGYNLRLGFYLTPNDPFCCIDMDIKAEWSPEEQASAGARYEAVTRTFNSYTEVSSSGLGLHIWVYALPQEGKRRDHIEMYSQWRFMVCTGHHWNITPLDVKGAPGTPDELRIHELVQMMRSDMNDIKPMSSFQMTELTPDQFEDDPYAKTMADIYDMGVAASNGVLFKQLIEGRWQPNEVSYELGERAFPSASEAEFALIDMLCFYTPYNFQVREMFMMTPFGDRYDDLRRQQGQKIKRKVHLEYMIKKYRFDQFMKAQENRAIADNNIERAIANLEKARLQAAPEPAPQEFPATNGGYVEERDGGLEWPPGFVGELARYMFQISLRPVKDVSILAALSLMSGICGKAWNTHTEGGLNSYIFLIARSGIGKDGYKSSIDRVLRTVEMYGGKDGAPLIGASSVLDTSRYGSEPALMKATIIPTLNADSTPGQGNGRLSFLHYVEEVSGFISELAQNRGKAPEIAHLMLTLYNASAFHSKADGLKYSNKDNNHSGGRWAAYSMAGEATPDKFYNNITSDMLSDGFMSRIMVWNCDVERPLENKNTKIPMPEHLCSGIGQMIMRATMLYTADEPCTVRLEPEVEDMYDMLDVEVNRILNGENGQIETDEVVRQLHNRRAFKILRFACCLAVGDNHLNPVVTKKHFMWAKEFVDIGNDRLLQKYKSGDLGIGNDTAREKKIVSRCIALLENNNGRDQQTYPAMNAAFALSKSDIRRGVITLKMFDGPRGSAYSFDQALDRIIELGGLKPLPSTQLMQAPYVEPDGRWFSGKAYLANWEQLDRLMKDL